jgi:hypothetical protein
MSVRTPARGAARLLFRARRGPRLAYLASAAPLLEPFPGLARYPVPGVRDRLEPTDLLDRAVIPLGLDIPMALAAQFYLARLEDRPGKLGKAGGHD